ncbi:hypothetical protein [Cupriavidus sp. TMH.W2]|uniref:hypothetical protein n=1 Tax=Cupriavidus sp. TMH.W2 TaxID=3434465 RepID=UPI003D7862EE
MKRPFPCALSCVSAVAWISVAAAAQDYAYTVNVQLRDGKTVQCAVNQPPQAPLVPETALSTSERVEAEVLATQRLRLLSGPRAPYPTPYTAPAIACFALSR